MSTVTLRGFLIILFVWYLFNLEFGKALMAYTLTQVLFNV